MRLQAQDFRASTTLPPPFDASSTGSGVEGVAPEDLSSTAAGGTGVGHQGGGGGNKGSSSGGGGDGPGVFTTKKTTLLDDPDLQYSSPVVSNGGVLRPTPQVSSSRAADPAVMMPASSPAVAEQRGSRNQEPIAM
ncbi:unnamed protein product [Ectocarpus sp. 13 AM-2016]